MDCDCDGAEDWRNAARRQTRVCICFSRIRKEVASERRDLCSSKGWRPVFGDGGALENASSPLPNDRLK